MPPPWLLSVCSFMQLLPNFKQHMWPKPFSMLTHWETHFPTQGSTDRQRKEAGAGRGRQQVSDTEHYSMRPAVRHAEHILCTNARGTKALGVRLTVKVNWSGWPSKVQRRVSPTLPATQGNPAFPRAGSCPAVIEQRPRPVINRY